jgi:glycosyltransferase involved in cell wall biosynthesis
VQSVEVDSPVHETLARPSRPSLAVVIPTHDNAQCIDQTLETVAAYMGRFDGMYDWRIVVIDDASNDDTAAIVFGATRRSPRVMLLRNLEPMYLGGVLRRAFAEIDCNYLVVIEATLAYGPEHISTLVETIARSHAHVVVASKYARDGTAEGGRRIDHEVNRAVNRLLGAVATGRLRTLTETVRAYDGRFVKRLNLKAVGSDVNTEILYKAQVLRSEIIEVPAHVDERCPVFRSSRSIQPRLTAFIRALLAAFVFRPFMFFIGPGFVLMALALLSHALAGNSVVQLRYANVALAAVGAIAVMFGIMALQRKRYFEELFSLQSAILQDELRSRLSGSRS